MMLQPGSRPVPNSPDYVLIRKIGAGAFGEVWHAHGPGGVDVALKFIRHVRPHELRSLQESKSIRHPNLVSLFGAWLKDDCLILAMEKCDRSLQDRLSEALAHDQLGIPLKELLSYMNDAANGLDALNIKQVQHRDVKPANLLVLNSRIKVADFGLVKALEHTVASNSGAGTLAYTAPECFKGKLTQQSDQYSLAVTYYHLRTGRLLFKGDQAQVMYAHLESEPDLSALPPIERAILARALSKEPADRWPDCKVFVKQLLKVPRRARAEENKGQWEEHRQQEPKPQKRWKKSPPRLSPGSQRWIPEPQITNHKGGKLSSKADFFAPPPPEIGQILTANTTLKRRQKPLTVSARFSRAILIGLGALLIGIAIVYCLEVRPIGWKLTWMGGLPLAGAVVAWLATVFEHSVSYVGTEGVAKIKCRHERNRIASVQLFPFSTASELRTGQTRHYQNFAYTNTSYEFTWSNGKRQKIFSLSGTYVNKKGDPEDDDDPFWFAHSAESVWSRYLLERTLAQLDAKGYIHFALSGSDFVRLGPSVMCLHVGGKNATIKKEEMGGISLGGGQFTVKHKDAKPGFLGFGRSGIFTFDYATMANTRLFLLALEKLMGYSFSSAH